MSADVTVALFLFLINLVSSVVSGMTSFGDAILLHVFWEAFAYVFRDTAHGTSLGVDDIKTIAETTYLRSFFFFPFLVYFTAKDGASFSKVMFLMMAIPSLLFGVFGTYLLGIVDEGLLRVVFGITSVAFGVLYAAARLYFSYCAKDGAFQLPKLSDAYDSKGKVRLRIKVGGGISSCFSGIMGSLTGVGGPPFIIFMLVMNVPSQITRMNYPAAGYPVAVVRFVMGIYSGLIQWERVYFYLASLAGGGIGLAIGLRIGRIIGPTTYSILVFCLLMLAAAVMITSSPSVLLVLVAACLGVVVFAHYREKRRAGVAAAAAASVAAPSPSDSSAKSSVGASPTSATVMQFEDGRHAHCEEEMVDA
jgi:uncharacterized membrane protein YfcA